MGGGGANREGAKYSFYDKWKSGLAQVILKEKKEAFYFNKEHKMTYASPAENRRYYDNLRRGGTKGV